MNFYLFTAILILFTYLYFKYLKPAPKKETPPTKIELTQVKKEPTKEKEEKKEELIEEPKEEKKEEEQVELSYAELLDKFCDYVQKNKVVNIDALSEKFGLSKENTIKKLREMEQEGQTIGFVDTNGEYFYLTMKEIDLLDKLFSGSKKRKFSKGEIEKLFDEICSTGTTNKK